MLKQFKLLLLDFDVENLFLKHPFCCPVCIFAFPFCMLNTSNCFLLVLSNVSIVTYIHLILLRFLEQLLGGAKFTVVGSQTHLIHVGIGIYKAS